MVRIRYSFGSRHTGRLENIKRQRIKYPDVMKDVLRTSDIILEVLDARFINDTRNHRIEKELHKKGKKIVYVINKTDLVNKKTVEEHLPTDMKPYVFISATKGQGTKALRERIHIEAKRIDLGNKKRIQVGIIGYPNTGKSSLINLITKRGVASTSKQAGHTKGMQKIRMTENILILDTPGVIPEQHYSTNDKQRFSKDAKLGARTYSDVKEPENIIHYLITPPTPNNPEEPTTEELTRIKETEQTCKAIENFYGITSEGNSEVLIEQLGKKKNFLIKGGNIDTDRTARLILKDWQEGNIKI